jgi:hypothetical protein
MIEGLPESQSCAFPLLVLVQMLTPQTLQLYIKFAKLLLKTASQLNHAPLLFVK